MWKHEWNAISSRISGIVDATTFLFNNARDEKRDHLYSTEVLTANCVETAQSVLGLRRYGSILPEAASDALGKFGEWWEKTTAHRNSPTSPKSIASEFQYLEGFVILLASIRSELDHVLAEQDAIIRSHVNRAFRHLDRSLVADPELKAKWVKAFQQSETECEKLGAAHLLLHGIWAFKANSSGQRTDIILGTHLVIDDDVIGAAHGLVLTEWKLVRQGENPESKKNEAKFQASQYSEGGMAGFQLDTERYIVLVGEAEFPVPEDETDGQVSYKVIPLFLTRRSPSAAARLLG